MSENLLKAVKNNSLTPEQAVQQANQLPVSPVRTSGAVRTFTPRPKAERIGQYMDEKLGSASRRVQEEMLKPTGLDEYIGELAPKVEKAVDEGVTTVKTKAGEWIDGFMKQASDIYENSGAKARVTELAGKVNNKLDDLGLKVWYQNARNNSMVKAVEDTLRGKGILDDLPEPMKNAIRLQTGSIMADGLEAHYYANQLNKILKVDSPEFKYFDDAFRGDDTNLTKLPEDARKILYELRGIRQTNAERIANNLTAIEGDQLARMMEGLDIDPKAVDSVTQLRDKILNQGMDYSTRSYESFMKGSKFVPTAEQRTKAIESMVRDWEITPEKASSILDDFASKKEGAWTNLKKVSTKNFKKRNELPAELREYLGEVRDPRYNIINTLRKQSEIANTFDVFKFGKEQGLFSDVKTATHTEAVPSGGPLAWGVVSGTYTTPEVASYLGFIKEFHKETDSWLLSWLKHIKTAKTMASPKAMGHQIFGNTMYFAPLSGVSPMSHPQRYKEAWQVMSDIRKVMNGELPKTHKAYEIYKEAVAHNILGNEVANADELKFLGENISKPWERLRDWRDINSFKDLVQETGKIYSAQDGLYKLATYLEYTRGRGMNAVDAMNEVYKWYPNPKEAGRLAQMARNTATGVFFANPFTTFASESHRIMLNAIKDSPRTRFMFGLMAGSKLAYNSALMLAMGYGIQDVMALVNSRPEAASEVLFNPSDPSFDLNMKYIDPFNTSGLFAPLMALSGATGVNPFDYLLDFTQFSKEFGYSNFILNAITPVLTGKGKYNEKLSTIDKLGGIIDAHVSTSFSRDLPKALNPNDDPKEQARRALRFFGFDAEDRSASYVKRDIVNDLTDKIEKGEDLTSAKKVLEFMGFDAEETIASTAEKVRRAKEKEKQNRLVGL